MDSASNSNMRPLFLLQKTAMRIITYSNKRTRATPLFSRLQILKLHDIFQLELAKLMHKVHNKALNICSASTNNYAIGYNITVDNIHSHNTRKKHQKKTTSLLEFHRNKPKSVCSVMDQNLERNTIAEKRDEHL